MTTLPSAQTMELLRLWQVPGLGVVKLRAVACELMADGAMDVWDIAQRQFPKLDILSSKLSPNISSAAESVVEECLRHSVAVVSLADQMYPKALRVIKDAPPLLFVKGKLEILGQPCVAVVGTREASARGREIAKKISAFLTRNSVHVVSGLALGIDTAAHTGCVESGGQTIAVLAHGLDTVNPSSNADLAQKLLSCGGALVSEHPPGVPPHPPEFVRRNRIQSGMSLFSIIVESGSSGGAIHQANFTHQQGREVYVALPQENLEQPFNRAGADYLMSSVGAKPISDTSDLMEVLKHHLAAPLAPPAEPGSAQLKFGW